jgi:hypothetical protein
MGKLFFDIKKCVGGAYEEKSIAAIYYDKELLWPTPLVLSDDIIECDDLGGIWTIFISGLDNPIADNYIIEGLPVWATVIKQEAQFILNINEFDIEEIREAQLIVRSAADTSKFDTLDIVQTGALRVELTWLLLSAKQKKFGCAGNNSNSPTTGMNLPNKVNWGDGLILTGAELEAARSGQWYNHTYENPGTYKVYIYGTVKVGSSFISSDQDVILVKYHKNIEELYFSAQESTQNLQDTILQEGSILHTIGPKCFRSSSINSILRLPATLAFIGGQAFRSANIVDIDFHPDCPLESLPGMIEGDSRGVFQGSTIERITLPKNLKSIGYLCFDDCKKLAHVEIPEDNQLIELGNLCFRGCNNAGWAVPSFPPEDLLIDCINLQGVLSIPFSNSMFKRILINPDCGVSGFSGTYGGGLCGYAEAFIWPGNCMTVGGNGGVTLAYSVLKRLYMYPTTPPQAPSGVNNSRSDIVIYVPQGSLSAYQNATGWTARAANMVEFDPSTFDWRNNA